MVARFGEPLCQYFNYLQSDLTDLGSQDVEDGFIFVGDKAFYINDESIPVE